jgi:Family of unknown function (DUF6328)
LSEDDTKRRKEDALVQDYNTILRESSLLTAFAGILFGFLLEISINAPESFDISDRIVLLIALFSITVAISFFVMPVVYHHMQYPYKDLEKFKQRSHRFIIFGILPAIFTLFLRLELALSSIIDRFPAFCACRLTIYVSLYIL